MSLWVVRAGRYGEQQEVALNEGLICHSWNELPDCSQFRTREELKQFYKRANPTASETQVNNGVGQVWRFAREIKKGDLVALPLKTESSIAFGRVVGDYEWKQYAPNVFHTRRTEWLKTVPRSALPNDILLSIGSLLTVFKVNRNDAEQRVENILARPTPRIDDVKPVAIELDEIASSDDVDIEEAARDKILKFIQSKFTRHELTRLVAAVLRAQGYKTEVSPEGPDGGVDILAAPGLLGFDSPRLCVQVKSGSAAEGQAVFNELRGVVSKFNAQHGLLVSWGGFTRPAILDARKDFFTVRLWDQGDLVDAILQNYERLEEDIRGELPLKRIWVLVDDETSQSS